MTCLLLDEAQIALLLIQPHKEAVTQHGGAESCQSDLPPDPAQFAIETDVAERSLALAPEKRIGRPCAGPIQPDEALEPVNHVLRNGHHPAAGAMIALHMQLWLAMRGGRVGDAKRAEFPGFQTGIEKGQHDEFVDNGAGGPGAPRLIRMRSDICQECPHLGLR